METWNGVCRSTRTEHKTWLCNACFMHVMGLRSDITGCYAGFEKVAAGGSSLHAYLIMISIIFALVTSWRYQLKYKIIG